MKAQQFKSLGLNVNLSVPSSIEEFDANAKKSGAALDEAINNIVYRNCLAQFRDELIHGRDEVKNGNVVVIPAFAGLEKITGVERLLKDTGKKRKVETKDTAGNVVTTEEPVFVFDESEAEYLKRVTALKGLTVETLQSYADQVATGIVFDASATERKPAGPKKLPQKYQDLAAQALASGKLDVVLARIKKAIGKDYTPVPETTDADKAKNLNQLGTLIKEFAEWNEKQAAAKLLA